MSDAVFGPKQRRQRCSSTATGQAVLVNLKSSAHIHASFEQASTTSIVIWSNNLNVHLLRILIVDKVVFNTVVRA